ncbi:MAG TPA: ABC transporter substrate-binding protein, partial [Thermomicrobiales bacterium]|nr:ABC transporter substrate-binding protein [Thermomicrobiales bacterium]
MPLSDPDQFHTANDLLQAGLHGRLTRRDLLERAAQLGLATGVTAAILTATGPDVAATAPVTDGKKTKPAGKEIKDAEITVGVVGSIDTLNPWTTNLYAQGFDVLSGVMDALVGFDSRQRMKPLLAESFAISDDGLTYTFELRKDVIFQNGDPLTSADIVATWQTIMNQDMPTWSRLGWDKISSIDTPSPTTAVIHTATIFAPFLSSIAAGSFSSGAIGPASILAGDATSFRDQFELKPVGTGPFRIKSVRRGSVILERYDKHWAGAARLKRITVRLFDVCEGQLAALAAGEIQIAGRTGSPADQHLEAALT